MLGNAVTVGTSVGICEGTVDEGMEEAGMLVIGALVLVAGSEVGV